MNRYAQGLRPAGAVCRDRDRGWPGPGRLRRVQRPGSVVRLFRLWLKYPRPVHRRAARPAPARAARRRSSPLPPCRSPSASATRGRTRPTYGKTVNKITAVTPASGGQQVTMSSAITSLGNTSNDTAYYVIHSDGLDLAAVQPVRHQQLGYLGQADLRQHFLAAGCGAGFGQGLSRHPADRVHRERR